MKAAIYARVSTDQQAEKGYSIETQLAACRKYARELGATSIAEYIDNGYSAEFIERPDLTRLRTAVRDQQFDLIVFYDPDRMARNLMHQLIIAEEIDKAGAELRFVIVNYDQSPDGRFMFGIRGLLAQLEKEKIKERTLRGKRGKAARGMVIRDAKPFGYSFDHSKSTYIINEQEAEIVRMIFGFLVNEKMGTSRICRELNARAIPTPRARKAWLASSVYRIVTNTLYQGIIYSMKYRSEKIGLHQKKRTLRPVAEWIPVPVPAIIDETTWQTAQRQLQKNKALARRNLKRDYLLTGLVTCAKCGRTMIISHSGGRKLISYYACPGRKNSFSEYPTSNPCSARQIPTNLLDEAVFNYLRDLYYQPDKIGQYVETVTQDTNTRTRKNKTALDQMIKTETDLRQQRDTVLRWFRSKMLTETEVERQLTVINRQLAAIIQMKKAYETGLAAATPGGSIADTAAAVRRKWTNWTFTPAEKRAALRPILARVIVQRTDNTRGRGSRPELKIELELQ